MALSEGPQSPVLSLSPPVVSPVVRKMNLEDEDEAPKPSEQTPAQPLPSQHGEDSSSPISSPEPEYPPTDTSTSQNKEQPSTLSASEQPSHQLHPPQSSSPNHSLSANEPPQFCPNCQSLSQQNQRLERRVARLRMRLQHSIETAQTHGQRLLRAAFQDKLREITSEHAQRTTEMLNMQKKCFEDELELMETETQSVIQQLQKQLAEHRDERDHLIFRYERERDDSLEKAESTMQAVQRKLTHIHARATRLEREKNQLAAAHDQKQLMIEVLASTAAANDVERRRLEVLERGQEEERKRKNSLIDSLQREIATLRKQLETEVDRNRNLESKVSRLEKERRDDSQRHAKDLEDCRQESRTEIDRMGRLFASMINDISHLPSDVTTSD